MRAVILAGGKGTRLAPYTTVLPKPLMPIGDVPILEIVLLRLKAAGINRVTMAVGHLATLVQAYCGAGEKFGMAIDYSVEPRPLGTAGPLSLIGRQTAPFFVLNGDVLTDVDFARMYSRHVDERALLTIAICARSLPIDLGVVHVDAGGTVTDYVEKPSLNYLVSMGIYVMSPGVFDFIPTERPFDLPQLVRAAVDARQRVVAYRHDGYWLDIGRPDDYAQAAEEFGRNRQKFIP